MVRKPLTTSMQPPIRALMLSVLLSIGWSTPVRANDNAEMLILGSGVALQSVVTQALNYLDIPYRLGGTDPKIGFDCSGLVFHVFRSTLGLSLPRTARQMASVGHTVERSGLQPGDLVFFNTRGAPFSHVGIYVGDSKFIHAPRPRSRVRLDSLDDPAYARTYQGARRIS